ncbi:MAG: TetR/AcrR family transcriptional regulator [Halanaerobiales bacterium]
MVQYQKEEVRDSIIKAARGEFIKHGYQKASIRQIAEEAGVIPSNIYNYFDGKDGVFGEVLKPLIVELDNFKAFMIKWEFSDKSGDKHEGPGEHRRVMVESIKLVDKYRALFKLLVFKSHGSSYEDYINKMVNWFTDNMYLHFKRNSGDLFSKFLIHNTTSIWFNFIKEILRYDVSGKEMQQATADMMTFIYSGHAGLKEWKKSQIR